MDASTTPNSGETRSGIMSTGFIPLLRELSSSFTSLGLQKRAEDESLEPHERSAMRPASSLRTPLSIPNTSIFDRNPQIVVGVLLKYIGFGWRPRLFVLQDGVLKYYKVYGPTAINVAQLLDSLRQQGELFTIGAEVSVLESQSNSTGYYTTKPNGRASSPARLPPARMEIHMQVGSVRESNADGRKFYVHSGTTTLTLRAETQDDRWVWCEALRSAKGAWDGLSPAAAGALRRTPTTVSATPASGAALSIHTELHAKKMREMKATLTSLGASVQAIEYVSQVLEQYEQEYTQLAATEEIKRQALLDVMYRLENEKRQLETALVVEGQRGVGGGGGGGGSARDSARGSGSVTELDNDQQSVSMNGEETEGADRVGDEEGNDSAEDDEFFECEALSMHSRSSSLTDLAGLEAAGESSLTSLQYENGGAASALSAAAAAAAAAAVAAVPPPTPLPQEQQQQPLQVVAKHPEWLVSEGSAPKRRDRLPPPQQQEKSVSLWSLIKEMVGKDLTRVCLPVYFNEPLSALEKSAEEMEYSELLDAAASFPPHSVDRMLRIVAFAVSAYSSTVGRTAKPFNPLLGETYELVHVEKGFRFIAEKVSHHPTIIAAAAEGRGWRLEADADVKSRFWGRSIELKPEGVLRLTFNDGDTYAWNKVTTSINNLILGKIYVDHGGIMRIRNLSSDGLTAKVRFKETSMLFDKDPRQVRGYFERNSDGRKLERPFVYGHWDDALHAELEDGKTIELWRKASPPPDPTRYNLTAFSIQLNELTPGLKEKVAPTDCRLRPDQAFTEQGMWDEANAEKQRLEHKQRAARRAAEMGEPLKPRWFDVLPAASAGKDRNPNELAFAYKGGYWEAREKGAWDGCRDIFGQHMNEQHE